MKRPFLIAVIGYILGILWGLYIEFSIVLFYIPIIVIYFIFKILKKPKRNNKLKLFSINRYFRYVKVFFNSKVIIFICIISIFSNFIVIFQKNRYSNLYVDKEKLNIVGIIEGDIKNSQYYTRYKIKVISANNLSKYENTYVYIMLNNNLSQQLNYGDKVKCEGEFLEPNTRRNYMGFNYKNYLKTKKIYGSVKIDKIQKISKKNKNPIMMISNNIKLVLEKRIEQIFNKNSADIFKGIFLGNTSNIEDEIRDDFKISGMLHILAISGMHVNYIILGIEMLFGKLLGKRKSRILTLFLLLIYVFIVGFSPSIVRASIMAMTFIFSKLLYRKNDTYNAISISLLINLIYNPFLITDVGLQLSYMGAISIIIFYSKIYKIIEKIKMPEKLKEILITTISVQIFILPITIYNFNIIGIYMFISNIFVGFLIGPIIILGVLLIFISLIFFEIAQLFSCLFDMLIYFLIFISKLSQLPLSKIYIPTPSVFIIILYYIIVFLINYLIYLYGEINLNSTHQRMKNLISLLKYKIRNNKKKARKIFLVILILVICIRIIPKDLKIHFVDVGQGDCCFIVTPSNKTILIDGGGSTSNEYDVGKNTLIPYLLDRGYKKIDYVFISHFDQDHFGGIVTVLEELQVNNVIISKQFEKSENFDKFLELIKEKKINVLLVNKGDKINIEKNLYFSILWPDDNELISNNPLNNNSIVCKLNYKNFSMLFTGDIEEEAEKEILNLYGSNSEILNSTVLKVAHHGSKTSSTQQFLEAVKPNIAIIGVGQDNKFGHPSSDVLNRMNELRCENL